MHLPPCEPLADTVLSMADVDGPHPPIVRSAAPDLLHLPFDNTYARLGPRSRGGWSPRRCCARAPCFSKIERLRLLLRDPFTEQPGMESYADPPPDWGRHLVVSYSS